MSIFCHFRRICVQHYCNTKPKVFTLKKYSTYYFIIIQCCVSFCCLLCSAVKLCSCILHFYFPKSWSNLIYFLTWCSESRIWPEMLRAFKHSHLKDCSFQPVSYCNPEAGLQTLIWGRVARYFDQLILWWLKGKYSNAKSFHRVKMCAVCVEEGDWICPR